MDIKERSGYSFGGETDLGFDEAVSRVIEALGEQGFGIITQIDAQKVMKEKLSVDMRPYKILGACNPGFAHKAIEMEPEIGSLLPCNVLVYEQDDGRVAVSAMNPEAALALSGNPAVEGIAAEVRERIRMALESL